MEECEALQVEKTEGFRENKDCCGKKGREMNIQSKIGFIFLAIRGITCHICGGLERRWSIGSKFEMDV